MMPSADLRARVDEWFTTTRYDGDGRTLTVKAILRDLLAALAQAAQEANTEYWVPRIVHLRKVDELEAQLAAVTAELQMGHARLDETTRARDVKGTLYERISKLIEQLVWEKSEIECLLNATGLEKDAMQASLGAAEHRRAAAEYRATRIELDKELLARAEKAETALRTLQRAQEGLTLKLRLRDEDWCIALINTLALDDVSAVLKTFNASRTDDRAALTPGSGDA